MNPSEEVALITRAVLRLARSLRAARGDAVVSAAGFGLLATLQQGGPMTATRLAQVERLQPQSLSRLIAALERDGLIERRRDPLDGRALILALSLEGRRVLRREIEQRRQWLSAALEATLDPDERRLLVSAAPLMIALAERSPPP